MVENLTGGSNLRDPITGVSLAIGAIQTGVSLFNGNQAAQSNKAIQQAEMERNRQTEERNKRTDARNERIDTENTRTIGDLRSLDQRNEARIEEQRKTLTEYASRLQSTVQRQDYESQAGRDVSLASRDVVSAFQRLGVSGNSSAAFGALAQTAGGVRSQATKQFLSDRLQEEGQIRGLRGQLLSSMPTSVQSQVPLQGQQGYQGYGGVSGYDQDPYGQFNENLGGVGAWLGGRTPRANPANPYAPAVGNFGGVPTGTNDPAFGVRRT